MQISITEEGPREGFQIEPGPIATADKIRLIEALSQTGLKSIQVCSFVSQRLVPGWADADAVVPTRLRIRSGDDGSTNRSSGTRTTSGAAELWPSRVGADRSKAHGCTANTVIRGRFAVGVDSFGA